MLNSFFFLTQYCFLLLVNLQWMSMSWLYATLLEQLSCLNNVVHRSKPVQTKTVQMHALFFYLNK